MADRSDTDLRIVDQFDWNVFWERHGNKIVLLVGVLLLIGIGLLYRQKQIAQEAGRAATRLAEAHDIKSLEDIVREYPRTETAAQALLRLAEMQYRAGQYPDAAASYQKFRQQFPRHGLVESADLGLAAIKEAQGDLAGAQNDYLRVANLYPNGYTSLASRIGAARCAEALGQRQQAQQLYEEVMAQGQDTPWYSTAYVRSRVLGREPAPGTTNAPPAAATVMPQLPATAPTPAPATNPPGK